MPILNYTTTIKAAVTVGQIQAILARAGAGSVRIDFEAGQPVAVMFIVELGGREIAFRLPANAAGVFARLKNDPAVPAKLRTQAHARDVAWRITKDWLEVQLAIISAGQAEMAEVFLPYAINPRTGLTLFQEFKSSGFLLGPGGDSQ